MAVGHRTENVKLIRVTSHRRNTHLQFLATTTLTSPGDSSLRNLDTVLHVEEKDSMYDTVVDRESLPVAKLVKSGKPSAGIYLFGDSVVPSSYWSTGIISSLAQACPHGSITECSLNRALQLSYIQPTGEIFIVTMPTDGPSTPPRPGAATTGSDSGSHLTPDQLQRIVCRTMKDPLLCVEPNMTFYRKSTV